MSVNEIEWKGCMGDGNVLEKNSTTLNYNVSEWNNEWNVVVHHLTAYNWFGQLMALAHP